MKTTEIEKKKSAFAAKPASARASKISGAGILPASNGRDTHATRGVAMFGRDLFVEALEREGVEVIFAYPGGASMEIHQALTKSKIRTILPRRKVTRA
jgi:hypothetical protein